jgi:DNA topoisomerase I
MGFTPQEYWKIEASEDAFKLDFYGNAEGKITLSNRAAVDEILKAVDKQKAVVTDVEKKKKNRNPNPPFITSSLQQEASNRFGFTTKKTMIIAQQLYEGIAIKGHGTVGLITYMRTDSTRISEVAKTAVRQMIAEQFGEEWLGVEEKKQRRKECSRCA